MNDDNAMPIERRNFPSMSVLEWRVTQLEAQAKETLRIMVENKNEILTVIKEHNAFVTERLNGLESRGGRHLDRAIIGLAALASVVSVLLAAATHK